MCNCGYNPCQCNNLTYFFNWMNTTGLPCNPCSNTPVCKKEIPALCTFYNGAALANLILPTHTSLEVIVSTLDSIIGVLKAYDAAQTTRNTNILTALNSINSRINVIDSGSHAPYVI